MYTSRTQGRQPGRPNNSPAGPSLPLKCHRQLKTKGECSRREKPVTGGAQGKRGEEEGLRCTFESPSPLASLSWLGAALLLRAEAPFTDISLLCRRVTCVRASRVLFVNNHQLELILYAGRACLGAAHSAAPQEQNVKGSCGPSRSRCRKTSEEWREEGGDRHEPSVCAACQRAACAAAPGGRGSARRAPRGRARPAEGRDA